MNWTIGTEIGEGFALALAALVIIGVVAYRSTSGLIETAAMIDESRNHCIQEMQHSHLLSDALPSSH